MKDRKSLEEYLISETDGFCYSREEIEAMSDYELFDALLKWEGIFGYTDEILSIVQKVFGVKINY